MHSTQSEIVGLSLSMETLHFCCLQMRTTRQVPSMSFFPSTASNAILPLPARTPWQNCLSFVHSLTGQCTFGRGKDLSAFKCEWQMDTARLSGAPKWQLSSGKSAYFNGGPPADASGDQGAIHVIFLFQCNTPCLVDFFDFLSTRWRLRSCRNVANSCRRCEHGRYGQRCH